ncbi:hypothetical protein [Rhizobium tumorigenes]|uniref:hypothetical protein n=1 Tax=Rhizobium tumorigenes TaxID=2041385 RepID=UPI00241C02EA|nr:hypothetical protein [Rhizobium tumorigenes]WFS01740.1 hypothetical protein PR016_03670 [Rhizobium tumorigenes]
MNTKFKLCLALVLSLLLVVSRAEARPPMLKQSTVDGVLRAVMAQWELPGDLGKVPGLHAEVRINLDTRGRVIGQPEVHITGGNASQQKRFAAAANRSVMQAAPFRGLPLDKYEAWKTIIVKFATQGF